MTRHEFIFSDQRRHRIWRHVIFWLCWWFAYYLLFQVPTLELKGWGFSREASPSTFRDAEKIGPLVYILKTLVFNSLLTVVVPQAILTYLLLYWILPNYFYRKRNPLIISAVLVSVIVVYSFVATQFRWFAVVGNDIFGTQPKPISFYDFTMSVSRNFFRQELNSLPVLLGFAVMIKLIKRWWMKQQETEQVAREKAKAELQLLKAQVHPHFLFNTLNNIYFFTLSGSPKAPEMITKLSGLLHYILNECNQPLVPLEKEIKMIQDYVALEKIRYGDDMKMTVELPDHVSNHMIAPLLLIPFIENSFKHGASKMLTQPYVKLRIAVDNNFLQLFITNSRPEKPDAEIAKARLPAGQGNIGLKNVKKRLELLYPLDHKLNIVEEPGSFSVFLKIRLADATIANKTDEVIKQEEEYAMA
ncbi:MAG TPA: histidine kinase [Chitinophagaceae bacterium]|nr:histidine kinase [Chitinophagaceae bacterium]